MLAGLNEQSIGVNNQSHGRSIRNNFGGSSHDSDAEGMPKEDNGITFQGCDPSTLFCEFAAERLEMVQTTSSPEKRMLYLKMACPDLKRSLRNF